MISLAAGHPRTWRTVAAAFAVLTTAALSLSACGDAERSPAAIRVAGVSIDERAVEHWTALIARGARPANSSGGQSPRAQAIAFLISAQWLLGEAARRGFTIPKRQIEQRAAEQTTPGELTANEPRADAELEARAQWALAAVRDYLNAQADKLARSAIANARVTAYYRAHIGRYRHPAERIFDIVEGLPDTAAAHALVRRIGSGSRFAKRAFRETFARPANFDAPAGQGPLLRAIFSARVGVVSRPMRLRHSYVVFVLRQAIPARVESLRAVRAEIQRELLSPRRRHELKDVLAAYTLRWVARTSCRRDYVVPGCSQYRGSSSPLDQGLLAELAP